MESRKIISRRPNGTTFVELMTTSAIFLLLMGIIMSFYISGAKVTKQQDQRSDTMRRALKIVDKFEVLLSQSRLIWAGSREKEQQAKILIFSPLDEKTPISSKGINWSKSAEQIYLDTSDPQNQQFIHITRDGQKHFIGQLKKGESADILTSSQCVIIKLTLLYYPDEAQAIDHKPEEYRHERTIPLYNRENY